MKKFIKSRKKIECHTIKILFVYFECDNLLLRYKFKVYKGEFEMKQYVVDAFTEKVFSGNPAAICVLDSWLDEKTMMSITIENNLSETAFTVKEGDKYKLRWFTPGGEIDLCGHATLACAYVVMNKIEPDLKTVTFSTMSGDLIVNRKGDLYEMDFPAYDLKPVEITDAMVDAIGAKPVEVYMGRDLLCVFDDEKTVNLLYSILFIVFKFLHFTNTYIKICNILQMNNFIT